MAEGGFCSDSGEETEEASFCTAARLNVALSDAPFTQLPTFLDLFSPLLRLFHLLPR